MWLPPPLLYHRLASHVLPIPLSLYTANNVTFPTAEYSALELIQPEAWSTMDGWVTSVPGSRLIPEFCPHLLIGQI